LLSQHLKTFTTKIEELRSAACLGDNQNERVANSQSPGFHNGETESTSANTNGSMKLYGLAELGTSKGRVLLPSALQVFRAASVMNHEFLMLERVASEQLENVYSQLFNEYSLKDVVKMIASKSTSEVRGSGKTAAFNTTKESDISIGSALAAISLRQDAEAESELKAFLLASTRLTVSSVTQSVFSASLSALIKFKITAELYLFDLSTYAVAAYLKDLHQDQTWESSVDEGDEVIEDDLLPQQAFTQVGEHLLSLLQELESFASSNTIENLIRLQDDADSLVTKAWKPLRSLLELSDDESYRNLSKRSTCYLSIAKAEQAMYGVSQSTEGMLDLTMGESEPSTIAVDEADEEDDILLFVNEWLGAISDYTVGLLMVQICQISKMSVLGKAQLRVDLTYLNNVINALGLNRHPFLSHVVLLLEQDMSKISTQLDFIPVTTSSPLSAIHKIDGRIIAASNTQAEA